MHSRDFMPGLRDQIDGRSREEWEKHFEVVGLIEHLKNLGWHQYQWNYVSVEDHEKHLAGFEAKHGPVKFRDHACFAEFFSEYYNGYLRGDGLTVRQAIEKCLTTAQRYAGCEQRTGHEYVPYKVRDGKEYDNGLVMCKHCGFNGFSTLVKTLQQKIDHYRIALQVEKRYAAEQIQHFIETGKTLQESFEEGLKGVIDRVAGSDDGTT